MSSYRDNLHLYLLIATVFGSQCFILLASSLAGKKLDMPHIDYMIVNKPGVVTLFLIFSLVSVGFFSLVIKTALKRRKVTASAD